MRDLTPKLEELENKREELANADINALVEAEIAKQRVEIEARVVAKQKADLHDYDVRIDAVKDMMEYLAMPDENEVVPETEEENANSVDY